MITHIYKIVSQHGEITRYALAGADYVPDILPGEDEIWQRMSLEDYFGAPVLVDLPAREVIRRRLAALNHTVKIRSERELFPAVDYNDLFQPGGSRY